MPWLSHVSFDLIRYMRQWNTRPLDYAGRKKRRNFASGKNGSRKQSHEQLRGQRIRCTRGSTSR
jgi:hypothetical protein